MPLTLKVGPIDLSKGSSKAVKCDTLDARTSCIRICVLIVSVTIFDRQEGLTVIANFHMMDRSTQDIVDYTKMTRLIESDMLPSH